MPSSRNLRHLNLNLCFSNSTTPESESPPNKSPIVAATRETPSKHHHHINHNTPCPSPSIMIKNFNSLYDPTLTFDPSFYSSSFSTTATTATSTCFELELAPEPEPDLAAAFASKRFFFSSPGLSNSLMEYTNTKTNCTAAQHLGLSFDEKSSSKDKPNGEVEKKKEEVLFKGSVAVPTYSPDPYLDFRRSMQEMVEARPELMDVKSNWNVLHELLLSYLALNPKSTHKFILGAFSDLLVSLLPF